MNIGVTASRQASWDQSSRVKNGSAPRHWIVRFIVAAEWLALIAGAGYLCGRTMPRAWQYLNTDFPNYYLTARLLREGYNTDRVYEWIWIQREKDHFGIKKSDQSVVAFVPLTPLSALPVWPLTYWPALTAKHIWIIVNLALLSATAFLLHSLTSLEWRRIALLMVITLPLHKNLLYGQYYILLLLIFTASLWLYLRQKPLLAGLILGIGFGLKIFPFFFLLYFLRKKDFEATAGLLIGSGAAVLVSLAAFGLELNRIYMLQVLPWALRGEGADPFNLAANSLSSLLHHLFIHEPEWNPHPLLHAPAVVAVGRPLLQALIFCPAILLARARDFRPLQVRLEWSAYIVSLLAISTMPASYHFTLLILPMAIMAAVLIEEKRFRALALLLVLYLGICFPFWRSDFDGGLAFLSVPRLYLSIALCLFSYSLLRQKRPLAFQYRRDRWVWAGVLAGGLALQIVVNLHHLHGIYERAGERLLTSPGIFLAAEPLANRNSTLFISMLSDGYHAGERTGRSVHVSDSKVDRLAVAARKDRIWVEESGEESRIASVAPDLTSGRLEVDNAESPVVSGDGKWLAYLRSNRGRKRIWLRALQDAATVDEPITPAGLNVFEMAFLRDNSIVFAAAEDHHVPRLFRTNGRDQLRSVADEPARYPSVSPDGRWLAYSRQSGGVWNLWLRNLGSEQEIRVTSADCNDTSPSWEADSKTLVFASDCERALGLTALYRIRALP